MLEDLEDGQSYVMRTYGGGITLPMLDAMTTQELRRWVNAGSRIIRRELGKNADTDYDHKPEEYWESGSGQHATVEVNPDE